MDTVIIGNSAAGLNALESFRKHDKKSTVTLISQEPGPAYSRVLLPYYLRKRLSYKKMFLCDSGYYRMLRVKTLFGRAVTKIDDKNYWVELDDGKRIPFDKLLIATGARPIKPPIKNLEGPGVYHMWTLEDALKLEPYFQKDKRVLILGSGFIALQAAWSALLSGMKVSVFELMPRIMPQVLDEKGAALLQRKILKCGVNLQVNVITESIKRNPDGSITVYAKGHDPFDVDLIILGTGVRPNVDLLEGSSVKIDRGIIVNERMETNVDGIYAAGDVAQGPTVLGKEHVMHALWPTAVEEGKIAGANMAGQNFIYQGSLNMNVTEMFGVTVASMGRFREEKFDQKREYLDAGSERYVKLVFCGDVPVGGIVVGNSDDIRILGLLRPLIRCKRKMDRSTELAVKAMTSGFSWPI